MKTKIWNFNVNSFASMNIPSALRVKIYRKAGMQIGNSDISVGCHFKGPNFSLGKGSWINSFCYFDNAIGHVEIGDNCNIAMQVLFCTSTHELGSSELRAGVPIAKNIIVKDGCWIGARSTILPGVTIGKGVIIAAGSVVTKNCEQNGLYAGVPAKRIKTL